MPVGQFHNLENALNIGKRNFSVEQIAHAVDENGLRVFPSQRQFQHVFLERQFETGGVVALPHCLQSLREALRVAVLAAGADFRAAGNGIPRELGPFNA